MPPLPSVPGCAQLNLGWKVDADTNAMTRHFIAYSGAAPTAANLSTALTAAIAAQAANFTADCHPQVGGAASSLIDLSSATGAQAVGSGAWVGTRTGGPLAPGTAVVVSHTIQRRYRGGHCRSYLPLGTATDIGTNGEWLPTPLAAFLASWTAFANGTATWGAAIGATNLQNVSYYHGFTVIIDPQTGRARNVPTPRAGALQNIITGSIARSKIGSQRRRNRKS